MIKLINNEFKKIGIFKLIMPFVIFLIVIIIIFEFNDDMKNTIFSLIPFVGIIISILFSGIISSEIENGTFRFYLTKPVSRDKIYKSKLLTIIIYGTMLLIYIFFIYTVLCKLNDNNYFVKYVKYSSPLLLLCAIIIMLSTIFRNTPVTVGITILILTFSLLLTQILLDIKFRQVEYTFLPYMDFTFFDDKNTIKFMNKTYNIKLSIKKGIYINAIYSYIFYIIGKYIFIKKDIKN